MRLGGAQQQRVIVGRVGVVVVGARQADWLVRRAGRSMLVQVGRHVGRRREPLVALEAVAQEAAPALAPVGAGQVDTVRLRVAPIELAIGALVHIDAGSLGVGLFRSLEARLAGALEAARRIAAVGGGGVADWGRAGALVHVMAGKSSVAGESRLTGAAERVFEGGRRGEVCGRLACADGIRMATLAGLG